jgi:hypothetical protein
MPFLTQGKTNWKYVLIVLVLAIIVCGGILSYQYWWLPKEKIESPEIKVTAKLTLEILKNTEYYSLFLKKVIKLTNGLYSEPPPEPEMASHCEVGIYKDKLALGDLNNDGKEDATVILDGTCGGSGSFRELAIIINQDGKPYYLTSKDLGDRVVINSMDIESGIITLDMIVHGPEDGICCPSVPKIFKYKLSGDQLVEVEDKTADWKTYRDDEYGFEIKYPKEWNEKHFSAEPSIVTLQNVDCFFCIYAGAPCGECYPEAGVKAIISVKDNQQELSLSEFLHQCDDKITFRCENISVAGIDAVKVTRLMDIGADLPDIYVPKGNKFFIISYGDNISKKDLREYYLSIFNQMLSTFRFIGDETTNWQTYSNEEYGFEIKYPYDAKVISGTPFPSYFLSLELPVIEKDTDLISKKFYIYAHYIRDEKGGLEDCYDSELQGEVIKIGDIEFEKEKIGGGGMEYLQDDTIYATVKVNQCIKFDKMLYYEKWGYQKGLKSFDEAKETEVFNQILSTFRFLD